MLSNSSERGWSEGMGERGREGGFVPKWNGSCGDLKASVCSNQPVSAAGQVTTELIMLMNNLRNPGRYMQSTTCYNIQKYALMHLLMTTKFQNVLFSSQKNWIIRYNKHERRPSWDTEVNHLIWQRVVQDAWITFSVKMCHRYSKQCIWVSQYSQSCERQRDATQRHEHSEAPINITSVLIFKWTENETEAGPMQQFRPPITISIVPCQKHLVLAR